MHEIHTPVTTPDPLKPQHPSKGPRTAAFFLGGIGLLCLIGWLLFGVDPGHDVERIRIDVTRNRLALLDTAVRLHEISHDALPDSLDVLCVSDGLHTPPLRREHLADPWGSPYRYQVTSATSFVIRSSGPDLRMDTADDLLFPSPRESLYGSGASRH